jgi:Zn-dependent protease with chaperone function
MKTFNRSLFVSLMLVFIVVSGCKKGSDESPINLFSAEDDIEFGKQVEAEIESNPQQFPVLDSAQYPDAYQHLTRIRDSVLNTGMLFYEDKFEWKVNIIHNDTILNAFCTPGGHMYFYTGLIKYLDNEAQFAGVMGHEMSHADLRHSTSMLTKAYGVQLLLSIILGQANSQLADIVVSLAYGLGELAYSRNMEYQSDEKAVEYLYQTSYDARGVAGFFIKLADTPQPPQFLSTHPSPDNRVEKIYEVWESLGSKEGKYYEESYNAFKASLP